MRPIHMAIGDRHLVRIDTPYGARVQFEENHASRAAPPAALAGPPSGRAIGPDARSGLRPPAVSLFPDHAALKALAEADAARVLKPFNPHILCLALAALVLAFAATATSLDRRIEIAERV